MGTLRHFNPKSSPVTIKGTSFNLVAFYYPDKETPWDTFYQAPFLGNFYPCSFSLTINSITATFHNSEAAFQCTKWWNDSTARQQFENALTGNDAWNVKKGLSNPDMTYAGLGRDDAMRIVLSAKFDNIFLLAGLVATKDAYLLEHNETEGRDDYWSDNSDGHGQNMLGITLMKIRKSVSGNGVPTGQYTVKDFTDQVKTN